MRDIPYSSRSVSEGVTMPESNRNYVGTCDTNIHDMTLVFMAGYNKKGETYESSFSLKYLHENVKRLADKGCRTFIIELDDR